MLAGHITLSVGWIGTVAAFLASTIVGLVGNDQVVRACYVAMEIVTWLIIVPFCFASLPTGLIQALGTHWGLFTQWWIFVKTNPDRYRCTYIDAAHAANFIFGRNCCSKRNSPSMRRST